jgi:hypothetical protein
LTVNDTSGGPQLTSFIGTAWCRLDTYLHFQRNFTFCCRVFFSAFPQLRNNSISANNNNKKGTITTQFRFLYGASPCRGVGNSDKRKNTVWVRFELNFCFFCISWGCFFLFCFFPNCWRSSVESLLHRNKRKKESVIYLPRLIGLPSVF